MTTKEKQQLADKDRILAYEQVTPRRRTSATVWGAIAGFFHAALTATCIYLGVGLYVPHSPPPKTRFMGYILMEVGDKLMLPASLVLGGSCGAIPINSAIWGAAVAGLVKLVRWSRHNEAQRTEDDR